MWIIRHIITGILYTFTDAVGSMEFGVGCF